MVDLNCNFSVEETHQTRHTEISNQGGFCSVWCPFSVCHFVLGADVEAKLEISFGELVVASLMLFNGVFPLPECVMPLKDSWDIGF